MEVMTSMKTTTDVGGGQEWQIERPLVHLRCWGSDETHELPDEDGEYTIGAAETCWLSLQHATISRSHAILVRRGGSFALRDDNSRTGIRLNGALRKEFPFFAGDEIEIRRFPLIAESARFVKLRRFVQRLLGWDAARQADVELALALDSNRRDAPRFVDALR